MLSTKFVVEPIGKNELFRNMISQCASHLYIDYVLADSWFSSSKNFTHIVGNKLHFIIALKSNRLVALSEEDKQQGKWINIKSLNLEQILKKVWLKGIDFPLSLIRQVFKNGDDIAYLYLISSDLSLSFEQITTIYKKRWSVEQYHKEVKQITSFGKSPTKTVKTQSNHFYLSIMAYSKVEILKKRTKTNAFALKDKIYGSTTNLVESIKYNYLVAFVTSYPIQFVTPEESQVLLSQSCVRLLRSDKQGG